MNLAVSGLNGGAAGLGSGYITPDHQLGGVQGAARPGVQQGGIANGSVVEGLVTSQNGDSYMVRIGNQMLNAKSTIPLFAGQRFRAVWDASSQPPTLRLQASDMAVLSRFAGRDREVASALLSRGLPVNDDVMRSIRQNWIAGGSNQDRLGAMAELWARNLPMTDANAALLSWYVGLAPEQAMQIWKRIKEKMASRKYDSAADLLDALRDEMDDPEAAKFLRAHAMAGRPPRRGLDPATLLAPAWWPVDDGKSDDGGMMARVSLNSEDHDGSRVAWINFEIEGEYLGLVRGDVMTNDRAISANIRLRDESRVPIVEDALPSLERDLAELALPVQHLGVGPLRGEAYADRSRTVGLDMEM